VPPATSVLRVQPLCGDEVVFYLDIDPDSEVART
jgi:hypothetical protein